MSRWRIGGEFHWTLPASNYGPECHLSKTSIWVACFVKEQALRNANIHRRLIWMRILTDLDFNRHARVEAEVVSGGDFSAYSSLARLASRVESIHPFGKLGEWTDIIYFFIIHNHDSFTTLTFTPSIIGDLDGLAEVQDDVSLGAESLVSSISTKVRYVHEQLGGLVIRVSHLETEGCQWSQEFARVGAMIRNPTGAAHVYHWYPCRFEMYPEHVSIARRGRTLKGESFASQHILACPLGQRHRCQGKEEVVPRAQLAIHPGALAGGKESLEPCGDAVGQTRPKRWDLDKHVSAMIKDA
mmetsp:Transcript_157823/g.287553  ORF Transcript_157823/g.287553 Transcript_157823/m.287553 type:complete len:299 (-) Transcript_157823:477-1373(-)